MLEVERLCLGEWVEDHACSSCMVNHTAVPSNVHILMRIKTTIAKHVVQNKLLEMERERERERERGGE